VTQVWPAETFARRDSVAWAWPDRYIDVLPFANNGDGQLQIPSDKSFDGTAVTKTVFGRPSVLYAPGAFEGGYVSGSRLSASFQIHNGQHNGANASLGACVERDLWSSDGEVSGKFNMTVAGQVSPGDIDGGILHGYYVFARVRSGTLVNSDTAGDTANPRKVIEEPRGIFFGHIQAGSTAVSRADSFVVGTFQGGDLTAVAEMEVGASPALPGIASYLAQPWGFFEPKSLRLRVTGTKVQCYADLGGNPRVIPYQNVTPSMVGGDGGGISVGEVLIFEIDDPVFVDTPGRFGFGMQMFLRKSGSSGYDASMTCDELKILDGNFDVHLLDEFRRNWIRASYEVPESSTANNHPQLEGPSLAQAWTGDAHSRGWFSTQPHVHDATVHGLHLEGVSGADVVKVGRNPDDATLAADPDGTEDRSQNHGFYISQDPVLSENQRYKATFTAQEVNAGGGTDYEVGVVLRFTPIAPNGWPAYIFQAQSQIAGSPDTPNGSTYYGQFQRCYVGFAKRVGGTFTVGIRSYDSQGAAAGLTYDGTVLSELDVTDPAPNVGDTFELDFQVFNISGENMVAAQLRLDGTEQTLVSADEDGVEVTGDWTYDFRTARIEGGPSTGLFFRNLGSSFVDDAVRFGNFTVDTPEEPGGAQSSDHASVVVGAEDADKTGSLTTDSSWAVDEILQVPRVDLKTQTGAMISSPRGFRMRRRWTIRSSGLTYTELDAVRAVWDAGLPFDWTRADTGETVAARFVGGTLPFRHVHSAGGDGYMEVSLVIEELFDDSEYNPVAP